MKDFDWLFELTEESENEGEQILVECPTLKEAYNILARYGFSKNEIKYLDRLTVEEGERLGLDTY